MSGEIVVQGTGEIVQGFEDMAMGIDKVRAQVNLIQTLMKDLMQKDQHFGVIPGCGDKPTLLKAGAEKLALTFRLAPEYEVTIVDWDKGHREYQTKCRLRHIPTGNIVGEGLGTCSTMEGKFRFRTEDTGREVPKEYWDSRDSAILGGPTYSPRKIHRGDKQVWSIFHKVEHDNPADYYNTCEKMSLKRAFVCGILSSTAASDIFTQDIEDMPEVFSGNKTAEEPKTEKTLSEDQMTLFWSRISAAYKEAGREYSSEEVHKILKSSYGIESVKAIPVSALDKILAQIITKIIGGNESSAPAGNATEVIVPYGENKGERIQDIPDKRLAELIKDFDNEKKLADAKWGARNRMILIALQAEKESRLKGDA